MQNELHQDVISKLITSLYNRSMITIVQTVLHIDSPVVTYSIFRLDKLQKY